METENPENGQQEPNNSNTPPPPIPPDVIPPPANKPQNPNDRQSSQAVPTEPTKIIITDDKRKDKQALIANIISGLGFLLAIAIFIITYLLFKEAVSQNKTAENNLQLARDQFEQSKRDNEQAKRIQADKDVTDAIEKRKQFVLDSTSTQAQVDALKETQKDFSLENRAFPEIVDISIDTFKIKKEIIFGFEIMDLGKSPAEIKGGKYDVLIVGKNVTTDTIKPTYQYKIPPVTIAQGAHTVNNVKMPIEIPEIFDALVDKTVFLYFVGNFKYYSTINGRFYKKEFAFKVFMDGRNVDVVSTK